MSNITSITLAKESQTNTITSPQSCSFYIDYDALAVMCLSSWRLQSGIAPPGWVCSQPCLWTGKLFIQLASWASSAHYCRDLSLYSGMGLSGVQICPFHHILGRRRQSIWFTLTGNPNLPVTEPTHRGHFELLFTSCVVFFFYLIGFESGFRPAPILSLLIPHTLYNFHFHSSVRFSVKKGKIKNKQFPFT